MCHGFGTNGHKFGCKNGISDEKKNIPRYHPAVKSEVVLPISPVTEETLRCSEMVLAFHSWQLSLAALRPWIG